MWVRTPSYAVWLQLVDLVLLDAECLQYKYSELAAAALYHHTDANTVHTATGYSFKQLFPCIRWMTPFAQTLAESLPVHLTVFSGIALDDAHNIQTHTVSPLDLVSGCLHCMCHHVCVRIYVSSYACHHTCVIIYVS